jgi:iron(III) transport system substrate-binding protein
MHLSRLLGAALLTCLAVPAFAQSGEVNVYSYREPGLIQPLLDRFTAETGIKTNVLFAGDGLIERVRAEAEFSPADMILTVDIGNLAKAKELGVTQAIDSAALERVPAAYRDPEAQWVALSLRARVFYASKERVPETALTYEDIAKPEWKGRLCTRSGQHVYNIGLIATRIAHWGVDKTRDWLAHVRDNLNGKPTGSDRDQVKQIFEGSCDLAIGNTYYMGAMLKNDKEPEQKAWANSVNILFPNSGDRGTHVNISGAVMAKYAPHKDNALKLLEFLASDKGQQMYADVNNEYPVKDGVPWSPLVESWGDFKPDPISLNEIAGLRKKASELVNKVGFDDGPSS